MEFESAVLKPLIVLFATQLIYSASDFMGRYYMDRQGFRWATFFTGWFFLYFIIRQIAMFGQLYVFAHVPLGKTMALLAAASIILSNGLGYLFLNEVLTGTSYIGVSLAILAVLFMAFR